MPGVGITLGDELQAAIEEYQKAGMQPLEVPSGKNVPSRSEVVRLLIRLGIAALEGWDGLDATMSIRNMEHHTRMAVSQYHLERVQDN